MGRHRSIDERLILDTARELFLLAGAALPTRAVARALHISESVLYQRFGSKDALFYAAIAPPGAIRDPVLAAVSTLASAGAPYEARRSLETVALELLVMFRFLGPLLVAGLAHRPADPSLQLRWRRTLPIAAVRDALSRALRKLADHRILDVPDELASADTLITAAWGATVIPFLLPTELLTDGEHHVRSPAERVSDQLWTGMRPG
ncbi:MAG: TetR/AcrR family transcriptional regulator [Gemmatimonadaceae bacterium]|nr:TetR/AcrR family transcriptional regulator [Gemmatimonadaceae bacterium]